ncbi:CaiB/BaiF CoA transferase family protein [Chloroflexota bacterium]
MTAGALDGIKVLEFGTAHAAPAACAILGDLGASVIKIEARSGDHFRSVTDVHGVSVRKPDGSNYMFDALARNKRSITIDLEKAQGREIAYRLVRSADILICNLLPATIHKLGMDYESLRKQNPRLIYCHTSAFGPKGTEADQPGNDPVAQARSGICLAEKKETAEPFSPTGLSDQAASLSIVIAALAALFSQKQTGMGQKVETSLLGATIWLETTLFTLVSASGREMRGRDRENCPNPLHNFYQAGDGKWLWLGRWVDPDRYWPAWCCVLGIEELQNDSRFHNIEARTKNNKLLISILDEVFKSQSSGEWLERFQKEHLLGSRANTLLDVFDDPQVVANDYLSEFEHPTLGLMKYVRTPIDFGQTPIAVRLPAPELGQHTEEILLEEQYSWDEIEKLKNEEVI